MARAIKTRKMQAISGNITNPAISDSDPEPDFRRSQANAQAKGRSTRRKNMINDKENSGNFPTTDTESDCNNSKQSARIKSRGRPKITKKRKNIKKKQSGTRESQTTDPESDKGFDKNTRVRSKKALKTNKVNPSFEGSTADLQETYYDDFSANSEIDFSSQIETSKRCDQELKGNKFPSGSKITLRSRKPKLSINKPPSPGFVTESPSPILNLSYTIERESGFQNSIKGSKLKREGTFDIEPDNISRALKDASILFSSTKSSREISGSSVSFNYNPKFSESPELDKYSNQSLLPLTPLPGTGKSARKKWADSKLDNSTNCLKPMDIFDIKDTAKTPNKSNVCVQTPDVDKYSKSLLFTVTTNDKRPKSARKRWQDNKLDNSAFELSAFKDLAKTPTNLKVTFLGLTPSPVVDKDVTTELPKSARKRWSDKKLGVELSRMATASTPKQNKKTAVKTPVIKEKLSFMKVSLTSEKNANRSSRQIMPNDVSLKAGNSVRFELQTPPSSSTFNRSNVKKTPFRKENPVKATTTAEKPASRVKPPPNFSKIHERQYEKMENLLELQQRRAARAQLLLSGCKPTDNLTLNKSGKETAAKRPLFSPNNSSKMDVSMKKLSKPVQKMVQKRRSLEKKKEQSKIPKLKVNKRPPVKVNPVPAKELAGKENVATKNGFTNKQPAEIKGKNVATKNGLTKQPAEIKGKNVATTNGFTLKPETNGNVSIVKKGSVKKPETIVSKYGFTMPHTAHNARDMVKKREEVSKYRVNRRFELLMKMREMGK